MGRTDVHNGGFDIPVGGQTPAARPQGSSMNFLKKIGFPLAALSMLAINPACSKEDMQNARTQVANAATPKTPEQDSTYDCVPFSGCSVMAKDPVTNQFYLMLGVAQGTSIPAIIKIFDKNGNILTSVNHTIDGGRKITPEGVFFMGKKVASFPSFNAAAADQIVIDYGEGQSNAWSVEPPTSVAENPDD